jgi:hypothetical protein
MKNKWLKNSDLYGLAKLADGGCLDLYYEWQFVQNEVKYQRSECDRLINYGKLNHHAILVGSITGSVAVNRSYSQIFIQKKDNTFEIKMVEGYITVEEKSSEI